MIKALQFLIKIALLLGLLVAFTYFAQKSERELYVQSYQYVRAGEYKKGWLEFEKAFGHSPILKLFVAGYSAAEGGFSKLASTFQPANKLPRRILFALILSGMGAAAVIYIIKVNASYKFHFRWRIKNQEYTGKLECKSEEDLRRHVAAQGGELVEVLEKTKAATKASRGGSAHPAPFQSSKIEHYFGQKQEGATEKCPHCAEDITTHVVRFKPDGSVMEPQSTAGTRDVSGAEACHFCGMKNYFQGTDHRKSVWKMRLAWCVMGLYIFFVLISLVLGGFFLLSAR